MESWNRDTIPTPPVAMVSPATEARNEFIRLRSQRDYYKRQATIYRTILEVLACGAVAVMFWLAVVS